MREEYEGKFASTDTQSIFASSAMSLRKSDMEKNRVN
jgi:hypothetical protein